MENFENFKKYFTTKSFWRAFRNKSGLFELPNSESERYKILKNVYEDIKSNKYTPSPPHHFIHANKGNGVARIIPVFEIEDYIVY